VKESPLTWHDLEPRLLEEGRGWKIGITRTIYDPMIKPAEKPL